MSVNKIPNVRKAVRTRTVASCIPPISTITLTRVRTIIVHTRRTLWTVVAEVFAFIVICSEKKNTGTYFLLCIRDEKGGYLKC